MTSHRLSTSILVLTTLLAGCGGAGASSTPAGVVQVRPTPTPAPHPAPSPTPAPTPTPTPTPQASLGVAVPLASDPELVIPDTVVAPGDTIARVHVRLREPADRQLGFDYRTRNGTAYEGKYYTLTRGALDFQVGEQEKIVEVPIRNLDQAGQTLYLDVNWTRNHPAVKGQSGLIAVGETRSDPGIIAPLHAIAAPALKAGRNQVFQSDFTGPIGPEGGPGVWRTRFGWGRWQSANNELAPYTDATTDPGVNPHPIVDGHRTLRAEKVATRELGRQFAFSAAMLSSQNWFAFQYGYVELRAKVDSEAGVVPAFWLLPESGEWPPEIDIFEFFNGGPLSSSIRFKGSAKGTAESYRTRFVSDGEWHRYGLDWTKDWLVTTVDGQEVHRRRNPFHQPMYIIVNTAVGLLSDGPPDAAPGWHNDFTLGEITVYQ